MSSAINHKKRSHRSERMKNSTYRAQSARRYYSASGMRRRNAGLFRRFMDMLRGRKNPPANRPPKPEAE